MLQIELTQPNLDLLMEDPAEVPAESAPWVSYVEHPHVQWIPCRNTLQCKWWDETKKRERHVSLELSGGVDDEDKRDVVNGAASYFQQLYDNKNEDYTSWEKDETGEAEFDHILSLRRRGKKPVFGGKWV